MKTFVVFSLVAVICQAELTPSGLDIEVLSKPDDCERFVKKSDMLSMHYTGTLEDRTEFDSSHKRNEPFKFQIGVGQVIKGWDEGVMGMCIGEKRKLIVPPELGYGEKGAGDSIPGNSVLHFDIELLDIEDGPAPTNVFKEIDLDNDQQVSREELSQYLNQQIETMKAQGGAEAGSIDEILGQQDKLIEDIFEHDDKDKDGFITHEEFSGPKHDEL